MAQFCSCGSIIIGEHCTNKNCSFKAASPAKSSTRKASSRVPKTESKEPKKTSTRRSSKCITYNLYDLPKEEEDTN